MIWFACKQCGKVHGRPDHSVGTMIFCECGQGTLVPWESTAPEPEMPVAAAAAPPVKLDPMTFDVVVGGSEPPPLEPKPREPSPRRRRVRQGPRDPRYCFNHEDLLQEATCADCGESFCASCLVRFQDESLCGPCKNFRVRALLGQPPTSRLALLSALLAFVPAFFVIGPAHSGGLWLLGALAIIPQAIALALGLVSLRQSERDPALGGRGLALTGIIGATVTSLLIVLLTICAPRVLT